MSSVPAKTFRENDELISDLARFAEGICTEAAVRKKYRFDEEAWVSIGADDLLVEMVEAEKVRRIRNGAAKRESAQQLVAKAPEVLGKIMNDERQSAKHRIDSAKTLDQLAGFAPVAAASEDRVIIRIDLGADTRAKGLESNPADILVFDVAANPNPNPTLRQEQPAIIEPVDQQEPIPVKRGRGRPPGSKNKPKPSSDTEEAPLLDWKVG